MLDLFKLEQFTIEISHVEDHLKKDLNHIIQKFG